MSAPRDPARLAHGVEAAARRELERLAEFAEAVRRRAPSQLTGAERDAAQDANRAAFEAATQRVGFEALSATREIIEALRKATRQAADPDPDAVARALWTAGVAMEAVYAEETERLLRALADNARRPGGDEA